MGLKKNCFKILQQTQLLKFKQLARNCNQAAATEWQKQVRADSVKLQSLGKAVEPNGVKRGTERARPCRLQAAYLPCLQESNHNSGMISLYWQLPALHLETSLKVTFLLLLLTSSLCYLILCCSSVRQTSHWFLLLLMPRHATDLGFY